MYSPPSSALAGCLLGCGGAAALLLVGLLHVDADGGSRSLRGSGQSV